MSEGPLRPPPAELNAAIYERVLSFDGLRGVAFLAVYGEHATRTPLLWVGVDVFFVLSGFLITGILLARKEERKGYFLGFYRRRAFRLLPAYGLTLAVNALLFGARGYRPLWLFVFAPNVHWLWFGGPLFPLWSLAVEEHFYLLWPCLVLWLSEAALLRTAIAVVLLTPSLRMVATPAFPTHLFIYTLTPFRADLLCAGAVLAILWKRREPATVRRLTRWAPRVCTIGFLLLGGSQALPVFRLARNTWPANGLVYLFSLVGAAGLVCWALTDQGWLARLLTLPPLRYLGAISYTMYLVHELALAWVGRYVSSHAGIAVVSLLLVVGYASLSWFVMERPLITVAARRLAPAR